MDKFIELCSEESTISRDERQRQIVSLLDNGQFDPIKKKSSAGWLPLHYAARFGRADIVKLLITRYGCDPHIQTRDKKYTALHIASEHSLLEVVETLLQHIPDGVPAKRDKDGNTPLHAACRRGSLEIVNRLTSKYSTNSIHEVNKAGSTPLGYAVKETKATIARFLFSQKQTLGNPERRFSDFRATFPSFKYKQSLDHPVSIFVMGKRQTGKSTLIKSLQVEGYFNRTIGVFKTTSGVEHHSGGIVPSDVSSNGYGRAKFYELASCLQSTQENIFLSLEKSARAIFVITLSFKEEMKEMEANLLYWLSFIHNQYRSVDASVMPNIAVVGSFLFYTKLGPLRLDNRHRLHLIYHRVLSGHSELCSHFHFLGKYSMDCRLSESPGMHQLRSALRRTSRELRPREGEANIPSSCYVLLSALHDLRPAPSDLPVLRLSDIEREITQRSSLVPLSLVSLLPNHGEGLQPLLDKLVERKAILVLDHLNRRDPWVIFDEYKLISQIDSTLIERALRITESNPGIMSVDMLLQCLTPLSNSLPKDVLLNILHHFKITEVMAHGNDTKYFLPSVLKISPSSELPLAWNLDDGNYTLGFAQCILPQSNQLTPVFMPHFLYFMLYELFVSTENSDFDSVVMSHSALYVQLTPQLQIYVTIDSSAIILHMRCSESGVFTCLQYRNQFESIIHQQRALLQPNLKITEYIVPMEGLSFPIKKIKYVHAYGIQVNNLKNVLTKKSNSTTTESLNKLRSFEPYEWLSKLQKEHLDCLLDPRLTNVEVSKAFFRDLAKCVGGNWKTLLDYSELLQDFETNTSSDPEEPSGEDSRVSNQHPTYGRLFELFSSMSIFQTTLELISALKDPKEYDNVSTPNESTSENESQATAGPKLPAVPVPEEIFPQADSLSYLPPSSTSSSVSVGPTSHDRVHMANPSSRDLSLPSPMSQPDTATLKTCSTSSDASSITSMGMRFNVPTIQVGKALVPMSDMPQNVQFVIRSAVLQCGTLGGRYQDEVHNISFTIPPQAVQEGTEIKIEFAIAVLGPFTFPEGITPVSPVLWVRLKRENSQEKLLKPIEIGIHHAVNCNENSKLVQILCTQNQTDSYSFTRTHKLSKIWPGKGMLCTKLSKQQYFFCIAAKRCQEVVARTQYCVVKVAPRHTSSDYSWKLYFFITYALPACVEMVRQQFGEEYVVQETGFQFDTSLRGDPSVTLEYQRVTPQQWTLTKEGTCRQIEASKVEFGNVSSFQMNMNRYHMYPPNFTITASGHQATGDSIVEFEFKGVAQTELLYEVALIVPRKATIVSMSSTADDTFTDGETENSLLTHKSDLKESFSGHGRLSPVWSTKSEPVGSRQHLGVESGLTTPNNARDQLNRDKKNAMAVLLDNFNNIRKHIDNSAIRGELVQLRALTSEESNTLLESATVSDANERLIYIIQKGGVNGFKQFMTALQNTSEEYQGHRDLLDDLKTDLKLVQSHSHSARHILGSLPPHDKVRSHSMTNFSRESGDSGLTTPNNARGSTCTANLEAKHLTRDSLSSAHSLEREEDRYTKQDTQQAFVQLDNSPPTQYPRPDQYTTMEHIPEWFDPVATLSQCTHDGRHYFDEANYFSLEFPKGAIPERETVMIDIGVALDGPFLFPEGLRPMSPVFWLCVRDKKHFQFSQPVKVTIRCYKNTIRSLGITVLMRKHEEISEQIFQLEAYSTAEVKFMPGCECGEFYTDHFGTVCIGCPIDTCLDDNTDRIEEHEIYPRGDSFPSVVPQSSQMDYEEWYSPLSEEQNVLNSSDISIGQGKVKRRNRFDKGDMELLYIREEVKDGMEEYAALTRDSTSQQEYDMEHPILLPTPGPPIDPHKTREYIPEWISPVATLSQCTHDGRYYYDKVNNFSLEIPEGAILAGEYITIDIGVALYGPFQYPEGIRPISPVFWLCVRDKKFFQFLQPVRVTIPHFLNLENHNDIESLSLAFLKGDHEMNAQQLYQFQQAEGDVLFEPLKKHGVIQTTHFCYLCITSKISLELIQKAMFCIYAAIPQAISHSKPAYVYFFVTLLLPTCLDTLKNQIRKIPELQDHITKTQDFRFSKRSCDPALGIILSPATPPEWTVGLQFNKEILLSDIDFFVSDDNSEELLKLKEKEGMYPPRFNLVISCTQAAKQSQTRVEFRGALKEIVFDIPLNPLLNPPYIKPGTY